MPRVVSNALDPVTADPALFVDRTEYVAELREMVEAAVLDDTLPRARFLVAGAKGVGKTIFTRHVLRQLHKDLGEGFLLVEVDGRGLVYRSFLDRLAKNLVQHALAAPKVVKPELHPWLRELGLMVTQEVVSASVTEQLTRTSGVSGGAKGSLFGVLEATGLFQWTESRQIGGSLTRTVKVDERLLAEALSITLAQLRASGVPTVVFYNDLDQAVDRESPEEARKALGRLVELEDCVQVLNVRTEVLYDDLRRESRILTLPELPADVIADLYEKRASREPNAQKRATLLAPATLALVARLARINGNPWAFLLWIENILRGYGPDAFDLDSADDRKSLVTRAVGFPDAELLERAARIVDASTTGWASWCREDDLVGAPPEKLSTMEAQVLKRAGLLVARDIFAPELGVRLEPLVDLLRPSVANRLA
jgi:AAA ATPase domain